MQLRDDAPWSGMTVARFIEQLFDRDLANQISALVESRIPVEELIRKTTGYTPDFPDLYIVNEELPYIAISEYRCVVSPSFLAHCLAVGARNQSIPLMGGLGSAVVVTQNPLPAALIIFQWSIAHEYYHIAYRHSELLERNAQEPLGDYAVERDADLCAVAVVYRLTQRVIEVPEERDVEIRILILHWIFWHLRLLTLGNSETSNTHTPSTERLTAIAMKLTHLPLTVRHPVDVELNQPTTRARIAPIFEALQYFDAEFLQHFGSPESGTISDELKRFADPGGISLRITEAWQPMENTRRHRAHLQWLHSGTFADGANSARIFRLPDGGNSNLPASQLPSS